MQHSHLWHELQADREERKATAWQVLACSFLLALVIVAILAPTLCFFIAELYLTVSAGTATIYSIGGYVLGIGAICFVYVALATYTRYVARVVNEALR